MRTTITSSAVSLAVALSLGCGQLALADNSTATQPPCKSFKGMAVRIGTDENALWAKSFWGEKRFNLADDCKVFDCKSSATEKSVLSLKELRPGQELEIQYENAHGVLVAHQVTRRDMTYTGTVNVMDGGKHILTVHRQGPAKTFQIPDDCKVVLRDGKVGTLADVQPGHRVTVTYEVPDGAVTARKIAQTSFEFSGTLTAIDSNERTVKAKAFLDSKEFNLADDCAIVLNGQPNGHLRDLKLGDKLTLSYDNMNGVNVVSRIAPAEAGADSVHTASAGQTHGSLMPVPTGY
jgi:hypothetical protein